jgi:3-(3-hydroxy-phenyl)propionate hydroxylase
MLDGRHADASLRVEGASTIAIGPRGLVERDGVVADWFDRHGCAGAIVRPDHYVYGVLTKTTEATTMLAQLQRRLGR